MAFFGDPFGHDPFFGQMHHQMRAHMQEMDSLMGDMMGGMGMGGGLLGGGLMGRGAMMGMGPQPQQRGLTPREQMMMLEGGQPSRSQQHHNQLATMQDRHRQMMSPFGFSPFFGGLHDRMENLHERAVNDPDAHVYSHSTVISYGPGQNGQPRVYHSTNDIRKAGPVKEVRKTVRDSDKKEEKITIGHHIGPRGHVIEKRRARGGNIEAQQQFQGIDEHEAEDFDREWTSMTRKVFGVEERGAGGSSRPAIQAASSSRHHQQRRRSRESRGPIIEEVDDEDRPSTSHDAKKRRGPLGRIFQGADEEESGSEERNRQRKKGSKGPIIQEMD